MVLHALVLPLLYSVAIFVPIGMNLLNLYGDQNFVQLKREYKHWDSDNCQIQLNQGEEFRLSKL